MEELLVKGLDENGQLVCYSFTYYYKFLAVTKLCLENIGRSVYSQYRVRGNRQKFIIGFLLAREVHVRE